MTRTAWNGSGRSHSDYVDATPESSTGRNAGVDGGEGEVATEGNRPQGDSQVAQDGGIDELFLQMESVLIASVALLAAAVLGARFLYTTKLSPRRSGRVGCG